MYVVRGFVNGLFGEYGHQEYMITPNNGHFIAAITNKYTVSCHLQPDAANTDKSHKSRAATVNKLCSILAKSHISAVYTNYII